MHKIIQLLGALVGALFGIALGLLILDRAPELIAVPNRPAFLMAIVVASLLFGYLAVPYITVYPTRWAVDRLSRANAGEFALGVIAIVIGLLMGLLVGVPLSNLGGAVGTATLSTVLTKRNGARATLQEHHRRRGSSPTSG